MRGLTLLLIVLLMLVAAGAAAAYMFLFATDEPTSGSVALSPEAVAEARRSFLAARESLLAGPQEVDLLLAVDVPKNAEVDNPDHQEITASGDIDYSADDAELVYDFQGLANPGGFLGHFDTLDVIYAEGTGYLKIFVDGPPWVSIEPEDASNDEILRLRDVMLTTPMMLPGLLEVAARSEQASRGERSPVVQVEALADSADQVTAGIGEALEEVEAEHVLVDAALEGGALSRLVLTFDYAVTDGTIEVESTYTFAASDEQLDVEPPKDSQLRTFSSIFD